MVNRRTNKLVSANGEVLTDVDVLGTATTGTVDLVISLPKEVVEQASR